MGDEQDNAVDKQRSNNGRDDKGKFAKGNHFGFQGGASGNPNGRPKAPTLSEAYRRQLLELVPYEKEGRSFVEVIAYTIVLQAAQGSLDAAKEIADRTEGRPKMSGDFNVSLTDWRSMAANAGVSEDDVVQEARTLLRQYSADRRREARHQAETNGGSAGSGETR